MRRYSFAELGERDHEQLVRKGKRPAKDALNGVWRIDVVDDVQSRDANRARVVRAEDRRQGRHRSASRSTIPTSSCRLSSSSTSPATTAPALERELRRIDDQTMVGHVAAGDQLRCTRGSSSATPGLFRRDADKASERYTMRYMLTRLD